MVKREAGALVPRNGDFQIAALGRVTKVAVLEFFAFRAIS
jgi:hypothetical protein